MSQQELLRKVIEALGDARIEYMLTGSVVSSLQGEPRSTHDIDMVVASVPNFHTQAELGTFCTNVTRANVKG
jgi:predicted nucleotidyltransferase